MAKYKTKEEYWRAHGWAQLAKEVGRRTVEELEKRGIRPDPESSVYKNTFNKLAAAYKNEAVTKKKQKDKAKADWLAQHANDTDEELLAYLREAVTTPEQLKKTTLVTGGPHIAAHFGGWQKALALAGLIDPAE